MLYSVGFDKQSTQIHTPPDLRARTAETAVAWKGEGGGGKTQRSSTMAKVSMKALLESGVHFGHRTHRWNPNMKPYIFTERNGIHIIDLQQTVKALDKAYDMVRDRVAAGGVVLFVGTKRQAVDTIQEEAERCGMPYVTVRWLGGMLTNWTTMRQRVNELERLERMKERGDFERLTKKEGLMLQRKIDKLQLRFGGIRDMHRLPDLVFVVDIRREDTAVREANILNVPTLALVDTNCDPRDIDFVIPSNDDAIRAIKLMVGHIANAVEEGRGMRKEDDVEAKPKQVQAEESELTDEELLGEATLAKLEAQTETETAEATAVETTEETPVDQAEAAEEGLQEQPEPEVAAEEKAEETPAEEVEASKEETEAPEAAEETTEEEPAAKSKKKAGDKK